MQVSKERKIGTKHVHVRQNLSKNGDYFSALTLYFDEKSSF